MSSEIKTEIDLAAAVIDHLRADGWEIYQEVDLRISTVGIADIVAKLGQLTMVVECKMTPCFELFAQADAWTRYAHFVSVAYPYRARYSHMVYQFVHEYTRWKGVGVFTVSGHRNVHENPSPRLNRHADVSYFKERLHDRMKDYSQAGSPSPRRWTPFQGTCDNVRALVESEPGINFADMIAKVKTHYKKISTARSCLRQYIDQGVVKGIRIERVGREIRLYPDERV